MADCVCDTLMKDAFYSSREDKADQSVTRQDSFFESRWSSGPNYKKRLWKESWVAQVAARLDKWDQGTTSVICPSHRYCITSRDWKNESPLIYDENASHMPRPLGDKRQSISNFSPSFFPRHLKTGEKAQLHLMGREEKRKKFSA